MVASCFISIIDENYRDNSQEMCVKLEPAPSTIRKRRLSNAGELNMIQILSIDENGTSIIMPCNSTVVDELNNTYRVQGSYYTVCKEPVTLRYLEEVRVWKGDDCCGSGGKYPAVPGSMDGYNGKKEYKTAPGCGACNRWHTAVYKCRYGANVTWEECSWQESPSATLIINGEERTDAVVSLEVSPLLQTPYGFWRNGSGFIIKTATTPTLEGTNYNFSCKPATEPANGNDYTFHPRISVDFMPSLITCKLLVKVPGRIVSSSGDFCKSVQVVKNNETNSIGFMSAQGDCAVRVEDTSGKPFYLWLGTDSFRFIKDINKIACSASGEGFYTDCSDDKETVDIVPKIQGISWGLETVVDSTSVVGGGTEENLAVSNPFSNLFASNAKAILMWVGIGIAIIAAILIGFIIIRAICLYCGKVAEEKPSSHVQVAERA
jgi:hypothetical protein